MINKEYNLWCEKLTNIYRNRKIIVTVYSYNILILKDNFMKKGVMKKLNMFLCKYALAPISIVLLVILLNSISLGSLYDIIPTPLFSVKNSISY